MKELTIEQKAKRYDEALERAKALYDDNQPISGNNVIINNIFPELKESEDEKIRKELIKFVKVNIPNEERYIAWLEKQGSEPKWCHHEVDLSKCSEEYRKAYYDGWNNCNQQHAQLEAKQKPTDKVELKFKVGNWYQCTKDFFGKGVTFDKNTAYYCAKEGCLQDEYGCHIAIVKDLYDNFKLWTIQDAKDGDVLQLGKVTAIFKESVGNNCICYCSIYDGEFEITSQDGDDNIYGCYDAIPATKEQRDVLMKAMADAGYIFDFDKKEFKKIEDEEYNGEDYGIDSLFHAQRILEKTIGSVDGYQSDDGILEHKCAIYAVKKLYEQNHAWSEEDTRLQRKLIELIYSVSYCDERENLSNWLKSLKDRVQLQSKQDWSEEDEGKLETIIDAAESHCLLTFYDISWLKSIKDRYTWKPSEEHLDALEVAIAYMTDDSSKVLKELLGQLKKLKV